MPADTFEHLWLREFVHLTIEVLRLRRIQRDLMTVNAHKGLSETLTPLVGRLEAKTLAEGWASRKADVVEQVNKILTSAGLSTDSILAQTFSIKLDDIERIEHMIALAEARRNATLREIERHQQTLGQRLRQAAQQIEDGQVRVIESALPAIDGRNVE